MGFIKSNATGAWCMYIVVPASMQQWQTEIVVQLEQCMYVQLLQCSAEKWKLLCNRSNAFVCAPASVGWWLQVEILVCVFSWYTDGCLPPCLIMCGMTDSGGFQNWGVCWEPLGGWSEKHARCSLSSSEGSCQQKSCCNSHECWK